MVVAMLTLIEAGISTGERSHFCRKEAEHRIANSLQLISALVRQRARSRDVLDPQTDRIETVGKLHRFLGESTTGTVQLGKYLEEICNRLRGALTPAATSFSFDCPADCQAPAKKALSLGLITAELISNSLKYAGRVADENLPFLRS
jgi:two-component sensor histidine kinase